MPTLLRVGPFRFFFFAGDGSEPPHVHIEREDCVAKVWLDPVRMERTGGLRRQEINGIVKIVDRRQHRLLESWDEFFHG